MRKQTVKADKNILFVGGTSSGKTTLLSSCLQEILNTEPVITCENTNEIALDRINIGQLRAAISRATRSS